jgi:hypothetical protein
MTSARRFSLFAAAFLFFILLSGSACAQERANPLEMHNADEVKALLEHFSAHAPRNRQEAFIAGKLFYARKEWAKAEEHLKNAAAANEGWRDEAHFLLAETYRHLGRPADAEQSLAAIVRNASGGSYYPRALDTHIRTELARDRRIATSLLAQAATFTEIALSNRGRYLLLASRQAEAERKNAEAKDYLVRAFRLPPARGWGDAIVDAGLDWEARRLLNPNDTLDLVVAMINVQRDRAALAQIEGLARTSLAVTNRIRLLDIRCWLERRMSAWDRALRTIEELEQIARENPETNARWTALRLRFLVAQARANFPAMHDTASAMLLADRQEAASWWRTLITECKDRDQRMALALTYLDTWPNEHSIEQNLRDDIISLYLEDRFEAAETMAQRALMRIQNRGFRSAILYFRYRRLAETGGTAASRQAAYAVIREAPLSLYHYHLRGLPPASGPAAESESPSAENSFFYWQREADLSFIVSPERREEIFTEFRARINTLPQRELLMLSDTIDFNILANILPEAARPAFRRLVSARLWREALAEITRRFPPGGATLTRQEPMTLAMLARLAARGAQHNVELWCYFRVLAACNWQSNFAAVERACGGTIFSRMYPRHFAVEIRHWANAYSLDPELVFALVRQESAFTRAIGSWAGAQGLMQLMPATAAEIARSLRLTNYDLHDPNDNIRMGCNYLSWLMRTHPGNPIAALIGYNAGPGRINSWKNAYRTRYKREPTPDRFSETVPFRETKDYIRLVLSGYMIYTYLGTGTLPGAQN